MSLVVRRHRRANRRLACQPRKEVAKRLANSAEYLPGYEKILCKTLYESRVISRQQASLNALDKIYRECLGTSYGNYKAYIDKLSQNPMISGYDSEFSGFKIVKIKYDPDDNCFVYAQVSGKNLKHDVKLLRERFR
jgi:hypothetical protein